MRQILSVLAIMLAAVGGSPAGRADQDADNQLMLAQMSAMMGHVPEALKTIDDVLADDPDYALAYLVRAQILERAGEFGKSADDFSQAIAKGFDHSPYVYTERGNMRAAGGDYAQALADYNQALTFNPGFWPAIAGRGAVLAESGDTIAALADLDRALAHDPGAMTETLRAEHVQVQSRKGPPQQGTNSLTVTIQTAPVMAASYVARGKLRFAQGAYRPALADLDEAVKRVPALASAHFYRGLTLLALGRCQEGQDEFRAEGVSATALFQAAIARYHDAVAKAGCAVEKL